MTPSRLQAHIQADQRAKRRDFDLRYGNNRRRPYGVTKKRYLARQVTPGKLYGELATLGLFFGALCLLLIASSAF